MLGAGWRGVAMVVAILGALVVLGVQVQRVLNPEEEASERRDRPDRAVDADADELGDGPSFADAEVDLRSFATGDCVTWAASGGRVSADVVDCAEPHLVEMIQRVDLPDGLTDYPTDDEWSGLFEQLCTDLAVDYVAGRLDPSGAFGVGGIKPLEDAWATGIRYLECGLSRWDGGDVMVPFTGRVAEVDQSLILPVGSCLAVEGELIDLVPCESVHHFVVLGPLDLTGTEERPSDEGLRQLCEAQHPDLPPVPGATVTYATYFGLTEAGWETGTRRGNCILGAVDADQAMIPVP